MTYVPATSSRELLALCAEIGHGTRESTALYHAALEIGTLKKIIHDMGWAATTSKGPVATLNAIRIQAVECDR